MLITDRFRSHSYTGAKLADSCWLLSRRDYTTWYMAAQNHGLVCLGFKLCILASILRLWKEVLWIYLIYICLEPLGFPLHHPDPSVQQFQSTNVDRRSRFGIDVWGRAGWDGDKIVGIEWRASSVNILNIHGTPFRGPSVAGTTVYKMLEDDQEREGKSDDEGDTGKSFTLLV
jgi:hypothetical protein